MSPVIAIDHLEVVDVRDALRADAAAALRAGDDSVFVALHGAGQVGYYGPVSDQVGVYVRDILATQVKGADANDHPGLLDRLRAATRTVPSRVGSWAVGAVDCAAWDLHGRVIGRPVAELLAPTQRPRSSVPAYASWLSQGLTSCEAPEALRQVAEGGWKFTKWGLRQPSAGSGPTAALRMAEAVQRCAQAISAPVAVDALGTWTPAVSMAFARGVNMVDLCWLEDPLPHHDLDTYELLAATGLPLAVGERAHCDEDPTGLIRYVRPRALTLDVVGCGGLTRVTQILDLAQDWAVPMYPHGRSLVPGIHLAAAFRAAVPAVEYRIQWEPRRQRLYDMPFNAEYGHIALPDTPGLGTTPRSTPWQAQR